MNAIGQYKKYDFVFQSLKVSEVVEGKGC